MGGKIFVLRAVELRIARLACSLVLERLLGRVARGVELQESGVGDDLNHAAFRGDRAHQVIAQVARVIRERARGGVRGDDRRRRQAQHVAHAGIRRVRDVHHHAQRVGAPDHALTEGAQAGIRRRVAELFQQTRAGADVVVTGMREADITRAARVQRIEPA